MLLLIPYAIIQVVLWFVFGDVSALAKSSNIFAVISTVLNIVELNDLDSLVLSVESYLLQNLHRKFWRRYRRKSDSIFLRYIQTIILVVASLVFQFI